MPTSESAREIVEGLLAKTAEAIMASDFSSAKKYFKLPQDMQIFDSGVKIDTAEDLHALFSGVRDSFADLGVDEFVRPVRQASFHDADTIYAHYISYLLADGLKVVEPYPVFAIVRRTDGQWKFAHAVYAVTQDMETPDWAYRYVKPRQD